jgi:peptidoglycan hydrolase CwlO-like protein
MENNTQRKVCNGMISECLQEFNKLWGELRSISSFVKENDSGMKSDILIMQDHYCDLKTDVTNLKADVSNLKADIAGIKQDIAVSNKTTSNIDERTRNMDSRLWALLVTGLVLSVGLVVNLLMQLLKG